MKKIAIIYPILTFIFCVLFNFGLATFETALLSILIVFSCQLSVIIFSDKNG